MDIKTIADLAKLADLCRKKGIKQLKITEGGLEFELSPTYRKVTRRSKGESDSIKVEKQYTDEDILMWSSNQIEA